MLERVKRDNEQKNVAGDKELFRYARKKPAEYLLIVVAVINVVAFVGACVVGGPYLFHQFLQTVWDVTSYAPAVVAGTLPIIAAIMAAIHRLRDGRTFDLQLGETFVGVLLIGDIMLGAPVFILALLNRLGCSVPIPN
jgi:hypothetical protein